MYIHNPHLKFLEYGRKFSVFLSGWQKTKYFFHLWEADLEKAGNGGRGACGHFVGKLAILRTHWVKYPAVLTED